MGNCCSDVGVPEDHWIYVRTGDRKGAGTDANVRLILHDREGHVSPEIKLDCVFRNDFERGNTDVFRAPELKDFGELEKIEIWRDNAGVSPDWYCDLVVINDRRSDAYYYFPINRWVQPSVHYVITNYDTALPQLDPCAEQREVALQEKRKFFQYDHRGPGLPVQVKDLPPDEQYSDDYKWDIMKTKTQLLSSSGFPRITSPRWDNLDDLRNIYNNAFPEPLGVIKWSNDLCFGAQRLIGCNPTLIRVCHDLPDNLGCTAEMLRPFLEGWTLKQITDAKRLFVVDMKILEDLPCTENRSICAPIGLFFLTGEKHLVPIAIQLFQDLAADNPVFLPNDPPFTWILAKMWFNNADAAIHQSLSHIAFTHLMMEGVAIATRRNLGNSHPIHRLLAPHFLFLMAINSRCLRKLLSEGGWIDKTSTVGRDGMFELTRRGLKEWRLDINGNPSQDAANRGVLNSKVLPGYYYRDDTVRIHKAISLYVNKIVRHYYDSPEKISGDYELQNWAKELITSRRDGGVGLKGVPGNGKFHTVEEIMMACTCIIYICSVQHAAASLSQYEEYSFPPNYPALLLGEPPSDKVPRTEEDIVNSLPNRETTIDIMVVTKLLSSRPSKALGDWEFQFQFDPPAIKAEKEFQQELAEISKEIKERNKTIEDIFRYDYLDPEIIPNYINL